MCFLSSEGSIPSGNISKITETTNKGKVPSGEKSSKRKRGNMTEDLASAIWDFGKSNMQAEFAKKKLRNTRLV